MFHLRSLVEQYKPLLDGVLALSALVNLIGWCTGGYLLLHAWRTGRFSRMSVGPFTFELQREEAIVAAAATAFGYLIAGFMAADAGVVMTASVLLLIPGVFLVGSVSDLINGNLVSGVAKGAYAALLIFGIGAGVWFVLFVIGRLA